MAEATDSSEEIQEEIRMHRTRIRELEHTALVLLVQEVIDDLEAIPTCTSHGFLDKAINRALDGLRKACSLEHRDKFREKFDEALAVSGRLLMEALPWFERYEHTLEQWKGKGCKRKGWKAKTYSKEMGRVTGTGWTPDMAIFDAYIRFKRGEFGGRVIRGEKKEVM